MKIVFLGTGTSTGVPQIACKCATCASLDSKDKRLRASILVKIDNNQILIDCGPDFRSQMLNNHVEFLSAVLITHEHYDHISGLDDLRPFGEVNIFAEARVCSVIKLNMPYCFSENLYPGVPTLKINEITDKSFEINSIKIQPIRILHAKLPIFGYRIAKMAYLTDVKTIDDHAYQLLKDLDLLILNALRMKEHIAHITLNEAIEIAQKINAKKTFFIHFSHDIGKHEDVQKLLPQNMFLSYDNLEIKI